jgi:hypothetical protein
MRHRLFAIPEVRNHLSLFEMETLFRITWSVFSPLPPPIPAILVDGWGYPSQTSILELATVGTHKLRSSILGICSLGEVGGLPAEKLEAVLEATARIFN